MTTTRKLAELFRAIATEDMQAAKGVAAELCKQEERKGHRTAARTLRGALNQSTGIAHTNGSPNAFDPAPVMSTALVRLQSLRPFSDVVLSPDVKRELDDVVSEWRNRTKLNDHGIPPRSKLLFHGPPGCGKSLTAQALGHELGLPVYMVRFDAVIGAFLGQTAIHLRQLFHFAESTACVLLLDELDALGKKRGNPLDVGELDRIVISLLQELEHAAPKGIVVGTTNLSAHLDDALWRRFDLDLAFEAPTKRALRQFVRQISKKRRIAVSAAVVKNAISSSSFATAEKVLDAEFRRQILGQAEKR